METIVRLNVGGVIFMTQKETLIKSQYFSKLMTIR